MSDQQNTESGVFYPFSPASGPGGLACEGASVRSSLSGEGIAPPMSAGSAAAVIGAGLPDDGREPDRSEADDIRVCFHESSHAAVGRRWSDLGGMTAVAGDGFSGRCWGPQFESRFANDDDRTPSLCAKIARLMPQPGESRAEVADIFLHVHNRVVELVAGTEGERMFCDGEPWFAADDERQAFALASLVTSSPAAAVAFIEFARIEAISLLTASAHIVRALAAELRIKRTMDGATIDRCIEQAVTTKAAEIEARRRRDWRERAASAARLVAVKP
jgi:hypothetical protein